MRDVIFLSVESTYVMHNGMQSKPAKQISATPKFSHGDRVKLSARGLSSLKTRRDPNRRATVIGFSRDNHPRIVFDGNRSTSAETYFPGFLEKVMF